MNVRMGVIVRVAFGGMDLNVFQVISVPRDLQLQIHAHGTQISNGSVQTIVVNERVRILINNTLHHVHSVHAHTDVHAA